MWQRVVSRAGSLPKLEIRSSLIPPLSPQLFSLVTWGRVAVTTLQLFRSNCQGKNLVPKQQKNQNDTFPTEFMIRQLIIPI